MSLTYFFRFAKETSSLTSQIKKNKVMFIKILLTIIFLCITVAVGIYSRKQAKSVDGFVLGGRSVGPWLTAFAYGTSYFSAVVFVGYAGQFGWKYGLSASWIGVGNAVIGSLLAWIILGRRTKLMTQHIQSRTMPDFFGTRYADEWLRVVASVIAFVFLIPYTAGVYMGISKLFEMGFGIPYTYCAIIMAMLTAVYVILGGYKATAINDFIQGIIMLFGITTVIAVVLNSQGGLIEAVSKMGEAVPTAHDLDDKSGLFALFQPGDFASWFGPAPLSLLGVVVLTSLGTWGLPQMVGKFYSITDESAIRRGTIISTVFALIVAGGCYFLGSFGRLFPEPLYSVEKHKYAYDSIVPSMLETLPDVLIALSLMIALNPPQFIAQLMGISWGALAGAFLAPFMLGLYWKGVTRLAVWACFVWGVGLTVVNMMLGNALMNPIDCGAVAMVGGFVVVFVVSLVTPKMNRQSVENIFKCYE